MKSEDQLTIEEVMERLIGSETIPIPLLYRLSDLGVEDLAKFSAAWPLIEDEHRRVLVRHLADISEENFMVDFSDVFAFCLTDEVAAVRRASLDGLWDCERVSLIRPILDIVKNDPDLEVRAHAAATLGHFIILAEWQQIPAGPVEPAVEVLVTLLSDPYADPILKRAAMESVAATSSPVVYSHIEEAYLSGDFESQLSAVFAMGRSADSRWLQFVLDEMSNSSVEMRVEAARAAGSIGHQLAVRELADLVFDEDLEVRLAAVDALGQIGGDDASRILGQLIDDPDAEDLQDAIDEALEQMSWFGNDIDLSLLDWDNSEDEDQFLSA